MSKATITRAELKKEGWVYSHQLFLGYVYGKIKPDFDFSVWAHSASKFINMNNERILIAVHDCDCESETVLLDSFVYFENQKEYEECLLKNGYEVDEEDAEEKKDWIRKREAN